MKQYYILLLILFVGLSSFAQSKINVLNGALSEEYKDTNIAYRAVYNELIFELNKQIDTNLTVIYRSDTLKRYTRSNYYVFKPLDDSIGFVKLFNGSIFLDSVKLRVKNPGRLELKFGGITSDTIISLERFLENNEIGMNPYYPYCLLKVCSVVRSFTGYYIKNDKKLTFEELKEKQSAYRRRVNRWSFSKLDRKLEGGKSSDKYYNEFKSLNRFGEKEVDFIKSLKKGDKIVFQMAKLSCASCSTAKKSVKITININ